MLHHKVFKMKFKMKLWEGVVMVMVMKEERRIEFISEIVNGDCGWRLWMEIVKKNVNEDCV